MPKVNPKILQWGRETAKLTLEEAAKKLQIHEVKDLSSVDRLIQLEAGEQDPSRSLLLRMSKQYHRTLLTFYMSAPPRKGERGEDLRTLPKNYLDVDDALLDVMLREVRARQSMLRAVLEDEEEAEPVSFIGSMKMADGIASVLDSIQVKLRLSLDDYRSKHSPEDAFLLLRSKVEEAGVFVLLIGDLGSHHTKIKLETFRGFALSDLVAPFVIINDKDSRAAWSFTLLHELTHLWLGQTAISGLSIDRPIERFCNDVAGEFLLPSSELKTLNITDATDLELSIEEISKFARARNISSSMVAYKLYRKGFIDEKVWSDLTKAFYAHWHHQRSRDRERLANQEGGPSYYVVRRHHLGMRLINLVQRMISADAITTSKAATVLGVKVGNVHRLIDNPRPKAK